MSFHQYEYHVSIINFHSCDHNPSRSRVFASLRCLPAALVHTAAALVHSAALVQSATLVHSAPLLKHEAFDTSATPHLKIRASLQQPSRIVN